MFSFFLTTKGQMEVKFLDGLEFVVYNHFVKMQFCFCRFFRLQIVSKIAQTFTDNALVVTIYKFWK